MLIQPFTYYKSLSSSTRRFINQCAIVGLVFHIITAWFSTGFYLYDEHYQIIEFAWMKLGHSNIENMPWEYAAKSRPSFQPWIALSIFKITGGNSPFFMAFILRLANSLFGYISLVPFALLSIQWINSNRLRKFYIILIAVLPIISFIHSRFSSEGTSSIFLLWGINFLLLLNCKDIVARKAILNSILSGICLALAFICRLQIAIAFPGILVWLLISKSNIHKYFIHLVISAIAILLLCAILDRMFYGEWVNSLWRYFEINYLQGKANSFGTSSFWFYIENFVEKCGWIAGLTATFLIIITWVKKPLNILTLSFLPYFFIHCLIGHKEMRFLFPMIFALPFFLIAGLDYLNFSLNSVNKNLQKVMAFTFAMFLIGLFTQWFINDCLSPSRPEFAAYQYLDKYKNDRIRLISLYDKEWPYGPHGHLNLDFYKANRLVIKEHMPSPERIKEIVDSSKIPVFLYNLGNGFNIPKEIQKSGVNYSIEYNSIPSWMEYINFNNWVNRQRSCSVFRLRK